MKYRPKLRKEPVHPNLYFSVNLKKRVDKNLGMEIPRDVKKFRKQRKILFYGWPKKSHISDLKTKRSGHVMLTVPTDKIFRENETLKIAL